MRTTIYLPDDLLAQAKKLAAESPTTFTALIEDALKELLIRKKGSPESLAVRLPTYGAGGLQSGVDLADTFALPDLMEPKGDPHRR
jgi:hypothetical protein